MNTAIQFFGSTVKRKKNPFISTWKTDNLSTGSSGSNQIKLPLEPLGSYNFIVDWGDGTRNRITSYNQTETLKTYSTGGVKTLSMYGEIDRWSFNASGDRLKILEINQWGDLNITSNTTQPNTGVFTNCSNLTVQAEDTPNLTSVTGTAGMFYGCTNLSIPNANDWDVSGIIATPSMFRDSGFNDPITNWTFLNGNLNANSMFRGGQYNQPIAWTVIGSVNCTEMFWSSQFDSPISITGGSVTVASSMFRACPFNHPITGLNFTGNTTTALMFNDNPAFKQDISGMDVASVTTASNMFLGGGLTTTHYDAALNSWASQSLKNSVSFHAGNSKYSPAAASARQHIIDTYNWTITDGGPV